MNRIIIVFLFWLPINVFAQNNNLSPNSDLSASFSVEGIATRKGNVPFWMRTNNYGSLPLEGVSSSIITSIYKDYKLVEDSLSGLRRLWDWGAGVETRLNAGDRFRAQLITGFLKARCGIFQAQFGRTKDKMGLADSFLSSGAFAVSGNASGIPKLAISIPDYWNIPGTQKLIAIKGNFALGYVGKVTLRQLYDTIGGPVTTYFHQKSLYGRIGKPNWKIKLYGGFNHQVFWGGERKYFGNGFKENDFGSLWYAITGKVYVVEGQPGSKVGNHIGSIDQGITIDFKTVLLTGYHQFFYDVGGLAHLSNLKDGLWGISFTNKNKNATLAGWSKFLVEFLYSKSQGGELKRHPTPSGDEDYYNNFVHYNGWTYDHQNIGNNFLTNKEYIRENLPSYKNEFIGNNRVILLHIGAEWYWRKWSIANKFSFSRNYGTYATSPIGNTTGTIRVVQPPPYFSPVNQFSGYIEASCPLKHNFCIGIVLAGDYGGLLYNSIGGMFKLTKSF